MALGVGLKLAVFTFNLIFLIVGSGLVAIGATYKVAFDDVVDVIPASYGCFHLFSVLLILIGCVVLLVAFFGCWGTSTRNALLLTIFAFVLLVVFILQVSLGIFVFLEVQDLNDLSEGVNEAIDEAFVNREKQGLVGFLQDELKCCGTFGPAFWNQTRNKPFPPSCCSDTDCLNVYNRGCQNVFFRFLVEASRIIGISVLAFSGSEVVGAVLSFCLANQLRNNSRRSPVNYRTLEIL